MTTESKARAAAIKARREAVGVSFVGFYDQLNLTYKQGEHVENGQYGKNITEMRDKAEKFLDHLEAKKGKAAERVEQVKPQQVKRIAQVNGMWHFVDMMPVSGAKLTFRILPNDGKEFTAEELAAFPPLDQTAKPAPVHVPAPEYKPFNDKEANQKQLEKFADGMCQSLLKSNRDIVTIPWAEFYEVLYAATGCGRFNITLLESIFSNLTCCSVPFLISFGNNVVVICKDSLFAPVEI